MDIYIKPVKKAKANGVVTLGDIAEIETSPELAKHIKATKILDVTEDKSYLISVIDIIGKINQNFPGHTINNVGEMDTIVEYESRKPKSKIWLWIKVVFVTILLAAGSITAIMSFHSDAQLPKVFENFYHIFFGVDKDNPMVIHLPYSIGLATGIIVFFNHFSGKKLTKDPTPIEVEMSTYESDVTNNIIDTLNSERKGNGNS